MCFVSFKSTGGSWFFNRLFTGVKHWQTTLRAQELLLTDFCSYLLSHLNFVWRAHLRSLCRAVRWCHRTQNVVPENIKEGSQYSHRALKCSKIFKARSHHNSSGWPPALWRCQDFQPNHFCTKPKNLEQNKILSLEGQILSLSMGFSWWWNRINFCR